MSQVIRKTIRVEKRDIDALQEILKNEIPEDIYYNRPCVSDLIRQGIFIVLAAFDKVNESTSYYGKSIDRPHKDLQEKLPIVANWPGLIDPKS